MIKSERFSSLEIVALAGFVALPLALLLLVFVEVWRGLSSLGWRIQGPVIVGLVAAVIGMAWLLRVRLRRSPDAETQVASGLEQGERLRLVLFAVGRLALAGALVGAAWSRASRWSFVMLGVGLVAMVAGLVWERVVRVDSAGK